MTEGTWRPLGVETDEEIAKYDALHDGVPAWMASAFWAWVDDAISVLTTYNDGSGRFRMLRVNDVEVMCQRLQVVLPSVRYTERGPTVGTTQRGTAIGALRTHPNSLVVADYLIAHGLGDVAQLAGMLERSKSAWEIGERAGRPALVRRVAEGVQTAADDLMSRAGRAGGRLARAWEELYGLEPNPSAAYGLAIKAVEDAVVPVVSPKNGSATLGTVLAQMQNQGDWKLPMLREHEKAPTSEVVIGMMRLIWHGQHDRHGGQPSAPGDVSIEEATVAVSLAVTLVNLFHGGLVNRQP